MKNLLAQSMKSLLAAFLLACAASFALAEELAPDMLIRRLSQDVLEAMRTDPELRAGNPAKVAPFVRTNVLPHFDFPRATQIAMGPAWRNATPAQREYEMRKSATGWKVYDLRIEGISLMSTYRTAFADEVRANGVDGLIRTLSGKNRHGAPKQPVSRASYP